MDNDSHPYTIALKLPNQRKSVNNNLESVIEQDSKRMIYEIFGILHLPVDTFWSHAPFLGSLLRKV